MKVLIAGGTGLLGSEAAKIMIENHHEVHALSLPINQKNLELPKDMHLHFVDFNLLEDDEIDQLMMGMDAFVFAAGVDERIEFKPPVMNAYMAYNVIPLKRMLTSAKKMGVKKAVVLGSYFAYFAKIWTHLKLDMHHPYIKSRLIQEEIAFSFADESFQVIVLELPYIFGIQKGRKPVWSIFIERFYKPSVIFFPKGGTSMVTVKQIGVAIYHAILYGKNKTAYPISYINMTWKKMIKHVLDAMNMRKKVITVPNWLAQLGIKSMQKSYDKKGVEPGLNPKYFIHLMAAHTYIDPSLSDDLKLPEDDIVAAIHESITYALDIYLKELDVVDMKAL
jgi:nucleoside-diphosphate-sugar epimerase